jgi:hypothetical protein
VSYSTTTFAIFGTFAPRRSKVADLFEKYVERSSPTLIAPGVSVDIIGNAVMGREWIALHAHERGDLAKSASPVPLTIPDDGERRTREALAAHGVTLDEVAPIGWYLVSRTL